MKMIIAVINNDDSVAASAALSREGFWVTKLSTTGGYLMVGNSTFLIGTDDDKVDEAIRVLSKHCSARKQKTAGRFSLGRGLVNDSVVEEVTVGGAVVFVLSVDRTEHL